MSQKEIRRTLGKFATGVAIISARYENEDYGLTVNSFSSLSLSPALILWSLQNSSINYQAMTECEYFAVNVLQAGQQALSLSFSRPVEDRFAGIEIERDVYQTPTLPGNIATLCCRANDALRYGDHTVIIGEIMACSVNEDATVEPLIFYDGKFVRLSSAV